MVSGFPRPIENDSLIGNEQLAEIENGEIYAWCARQVAKLPPDCARQLEVCCFALPKDHRRGDRGQRGLLQHDSTKFVWIEHV